VLSSIKPPTANELTDLLKQIDPFSPEVILRDSLARFILINDQVTVPQPLFLTVPPPAPAPAAPAPATGPAMVGLAASSSTSSMLMRQPSLKS
jgi:hypothetical protein